MGQFQVHKSTKLKAHDHIFYLKKVSKLYIKLILL